MKPASSPKKTPARTPIPTAMLSQAFQSGCWLCTASATRPTNTPMATGTDTATDLMMVVRILSSAVGCLSGHAVSGLWDGGSSTSLVTCS